MDEVSIYWIVNKESIYPHIQRFPFFSNNWNFFLISGYYKKLFNKVLIKSVYQIVYYSNKILTQQAIHRKDSFIQKITHIPYLKVMISLEVTLTAFLRKNLATNKIVCLKKCVTNFQMSLGPCKISGKSLSTISR